jgi:hypothetical protein
MGQPDKAVQPVQPDKAVQPDQTVHPDQSLVNILEHGNLNAASHLKGVEVHIGGPEFIGVDGRHDVFVFDYADPHQQVAILRNFDPGEDYIVFQHAEGHDVWVGSLGVWGNGDPMGSIFVLWNSNPLSTIELFGVEFTPDNIHQMVLPTGIHLVTGAIGDFIDF